MKVCKRGSKAANQTLSKTPFSCYDAGSMTYLKIPMTKIETFLFCVLFAAASSCSGPSSDAAESSSNSPEPSSGSAESSTPKPPSKKLDLSEALRRSIFYHRGEKHYKICLDSDGMTRISGRIVSNEELKTLYTYSDNREMKIYLSVYGNQDADFVFDALNSVQHWSQISYHSTNQESEIMQKPHEY